MTTSIVTDLRSYLNVLEEAGELSFAGQGSGQFRARDRRHLFAQLARGRSRLVVRTAGVNARCL